MQFNQEKCHLMTIGNKKKQKATNYSLGQKRITSSESERDLGIIVQSNLNWDEHVKKDVKKANQAL